MPIKLDSLSNHRRLVLASSITVFSGLLAAPQVGGAQGIDSRISDTSTNTTESSSRAKPRRADKEKSAGVETVMVIGTKSNLMSAQAIKRDADTMCGCRFCGGYSRTG